MYNRNQDVRGASKLGTASGFYPMRKRLWSLQEHDRSRYMFDCDKIQQLDNQAVEAGIASQGLG